MNSSRRDFLKRAGASAVVPAPGARLTGRVAAEPAARKTIRIGMVGVGSKGSAHAGNLLRMESAELRAVCDIREIQCRGRA